MTAYAFFFFLKKLDPDWELRYHQLVTRAVVKLLQMNEQTDQTVQALNTTLTTLLRIQSSQHSVRNVNWDTTFQERYEKKTLILKVK